MRRTKAAALTVATAAALTVLPLATAATAQAAPADTKVLDCRATTPSKYVGRADCTNNTNRAVGFRATAVCGYAVDRKGPWVTLNPGKSGRSEAICGSRFVDGTGVGSVDWEEG